MSVEAMPLRATRVVCLLAGMLLASVALADKAADVAALEAQCESEREALIKPLRDEEIAKCKADGRSDPAYCERYFKDYGNAVRSTPKGGFVPRMFNDLPSCKLALAARKALANGDPIPTSAD
jgi:hypothetical protein